MQHLLVKNPYKIFGTAINFSTKFNQYQTMI